MKARHDQEWKELQAAHKSEREAIWKSRASFKAIIAQHRTDTRPDWSAFGKRQARERREWHRNERSTIGLINNALAAVASRQITGDNKGYLRAVFWHCVSKSARLDAFTQQQAREKADFAAKMKAPLDRQLAAAKADTDKRIQLARANYAERKATLKEKQGGERSEIREAWKLYFAHRNAATNWRDRSTMRAAGSRRSSPAVGTPARSTPPLERAAGAQSVSELREAYGGEKRERNRDRDRSQSRRKERYRSRTRDRDSGPDLS